MNVPGESFCHLRSTDVGDGVKGKAVVRLVHVVQVLANRVDNEANEVGVLVHEEGECQVAL